MSNKQCEVCRAEIPEDFTNLLCLDCYDKQVKEIEEKRLLQETNIIPADQGMNREEEKPITNTVDCQPFVAPREISNGYNVNGITDPNYKENPMAPDKEQWEANLTLFIKNDRLLWYPTRKMYTFIKNWCLDGITRHPQYPKFIWKPKIVDVGCGLGVGANVLSQEADFVWGIDKNEKSIKFAKEAFERIKNSIYYSSQLTFDNIDFVEDTREFMKFDVVTAIEIIEHIDDYRTFLINLIKKFTKRNKQGSARIESPTTFFISTPNRNSSSIQKTNPKNKFHVREWTSQEAKAVLLNYFEEVELLSTKGEQIPDDTTMTPVLYKCLFPK